MALNTIWKYPLRLIDRQNLSMPVGASIVSAGRDPIGAMCIWALVDHGADKRDVEIMIVGTGNALPHVGDFIGTVTMDGFVWHVFTGPGDSANRPGGAGFHYQTKGNG